MKFLFRTFLTLIVLGAMIKSYTAQQYGFYNFNENKGLSKNSVFAIAQDSKGAVLLGTNDGGINILDGISTEKLTKQDGLVDNVIYDIIPYGKDALLILTNNGVSKYSYDRFFNYPLKDSTINTRVYTALIDTQENVWLATGSGLAKIDNDTIISYSTGNKELDNVPIIHLRQGNDGSIWCSTLGKGVFQITPEWKVNHIQYQDNLEYTFSSFQYSDSVVWLLTYKGLYQYQNNQVSSVGLKYNDHSSKYYFHSCIRDTKGDIWIATLKGVIKIDNHGKEVFLDKKNGLSGNDAWKIMEDHEGNIWVTFKTGGVSKLTNQSITIKNNFNNVSNDVKSVFIDLKNRLWLGTNDGAVLIDSSENSKLIKVGSEKRDVIKGIGQHRESVLLLSKQGINIYKDEKVQNINTTSLNHRFVGECIFIDNNRAFLGSSVTGVAEFKNNKIEYINDSLGMDRIGVFSMNKTADHLWWYATEHGVFNHDGKQLTEVTEEQGLSASKTRSLVLDQSGKLWVGNSEGIFYREGNHFYPVYKGDTVNNNTIYSMCFDKEGNLWAGKIDGIDKISITAGKITDIRHYDAKKGFDIGSLHNNAMALDSNGHILVGTDRGLLEINPYLDFPNTVESKTHIEDIQLFSQPTDWSMYADSIDENGFPVGLELDYNQNYFTFNYIGICHKYPEGVRYRTKLVGLDKGWVEREDKRFVIYGNLKPGEYTFLLKSCNNEGIWNKEPVKFSFVIRPPFWQTWWFYSICIGIVIAGIYSYIKIRNANIEITHKNKEITQKNHEIEEKNNEIMDSINYAKRIQDSILPDSKMQYLMPNSFVLFQPKDVVSGDFYWLKRVEEELLFAAVDCTGHGVPGAFVSMVGFSGLNRAVTEYSLTQPHQILEKLSEFVVESFAKHQSKSINDGMDASLCSLNRSTKVLQYSGANNSIYIVRKSAKVIVDTNGDPVAVKQLDSLNELKATRRPIGKTDHPIPFVNYTVQLEEGDAVYLFTDGFPDQFGGEKGKKYMYKAFKRFLLTLQDTPITEQGDALRKEYQKWAGNYEQVDDICIIGVKI
ncbi:MAG: SpoIIE family protein phosphatase [Flavobacteriales bacterium]|jgi:ligand-binding sensor domain-containing protein/serine phosphatase RsbU (regulator of sigma subunit)|nr:SpoIIE family protein phosphatase [Flavobacteriales bacterium]